MTDDRCWWLVTAVASTTFACSSEGVRPPPEAQDQRTEVAETSAVTHRDTTMSLDAGLPSASDSGAGSESTYDATQSTAIAATSAVEATSGAESASMPGPNDADASLILDPEFDQVSAAELCERIAYLEGESIDVDLTNELALGDFEDLLPASYDAGSYEPDAMTCHTRFAPYVVPCDGSVLVVTAPTLAFGEGPLVGGELVGIGCWEKGCTDGCLPEVASAVGKVRVRVTAPINSHYDEESGTIIGDIRVNGVDVRGIAQLEVLEHW